MTFWSFANFQETFLDQSICTIQMSEVIMSSPHKFPFILYTEITENNHDFSYENVRHCLNSSLNRCRIMLISIYLDMSDLLSQVWARFQNLSKFSCRKYMASSEVMTSSTHWTVHIHIDWLKKWRVKFFETFKMSWAIFFIFLLDISWGYDCYDWRILLFLLRWS